MLFNSLQFFVFFPIVTLLYFLLKQKGRVYMLLAASCYFYMAFVPAYILILLVTILIDYFAGIYIEKTTGKVRKLYLIISIISTCLVLFVFKYYNFFIDSANGVFSMLGFSYSFKLARILLPIGLSFHTFQSLSYVIEVYRKKQAAEKNFPVYALYVMFYPQLVAGPIERPQNLLHQFYEKHSFNYRNVADGLKLMLWGLFKKVVIADRLALLVNKVYNDPTHYHGMPLILATYFFTIQIYCDFSGYSDIAIGAAQVMGFKLMDNFKRPYFSKTISEFWRRWHISLSTWFKDYLYIPLGGSQVKVSRLYLNLAIVFVVSGFWHGANWTFIIWGALHAVYQIVTLLTRKTMGKFRNAIGLPADSFAGKFVSIFITFNLVAFAWIFFRANNVHDAFYIASHLFSGLSAGQFSSLNQLGLSTSELWVALFAILLMETVHLVERHEQMRHFLDRKPKLVRWGWYYLILLCIAAFGVFGNQQFIYFQF